MASRSSGVQQILDLSDKSIALFNPPYIFMSTALEHEPNDLEAAILAQQARRLKQTAPKSFVSQMDLFDAAPSGNNQLSKQVRANTDPYLVLRVKYGGNDWFNPARLAYIQAARHLSVKIIAQLVPKRNYSGGHEFIVNIKCYTDVTSPARTWKRRRLSLVSPRPAATSPPVTCCSIG
ncbi:hypothetical protein FGB62_249g02 [Gracilaria domingensis]|nr:hypothetical protein FGB62_249g02 [Gracilaria domingensis]